MPSRRRFLKRMTQAIAGASIVFGAPRWDAQTRPAWGGGASDEPCGQCTLDEFDRVRDDETAIRNAHTYLMWRALAVAEMRQAALSNGTKLTLKTEPECTKPPNANVRHAEAEDPDSGGCSNGYCVSWGSWNPADLTPEDLPSYAALNDKLAILFGASYISRMGGAFNGALNRDAVAEQLRGLTQSAEAAAYSEAIYAKLLLATQSRCVEGAPALQRFDRGYAEALALRAVDRDFINARNAESVGDPAGVRRRLNVMRYKIRMYDWRREEHVMKVWSSLKGPIFPLAAADPWPLNYWEELRRNEAKNPLQPIIDGAASQLTYKEVTETSVTGWPAGIPIKHTRKVPVYGATVRTFLAQKVPANLRASS